MINRPESYFTYLFSGMFVLQAFALFYLASFPLDTSSYEIDFIAAASQNPPLSHWLSAAGHWLLPDYNLGFRLFHIMIYLISFWGFFLFVRHRLDSRTAFYSCCILASSLPFISHMQMATPEGLATIFMAASIFGFYHYLKTNQKHYFWLMYGSLGLALLAKGLIAVIIPLVILALYLMYRIKMNSEHLKKIQIGKGLVFTVLVGLPCLLFSEEKDFNNWMTTFLNTIHWEQDSTYFPVKEGAFYLPFIFIIVGMLPFGSFLPRSFGFSWKFRQKKPILLISALYLVFILVFFAFAEQFRLSYLLPAIPFAAVLIGYQLSQLSGRSLSKMNLYVGPGIIALLAIIVPIILFVMLQESQEEGVMENLTFIILLGTLPVGTLLFFGFWQFKRTDAGVMALTVTYLLFNLLLIEFSFTHEPLLNYLKEIFYVFPI